MKKFLFYLMALPSVFLCVACGDDGDDDPTNNNVTVTVTSVNLTDDGYFDGIMYYKISSNSPKEVTVNKAEKSAVTVAIPSIVNIDGSNYKCTSISRNAFYDCSRLTSIIIPNSVTSIDMWAFYGCSSLTSVDIPSSVTTIEYGAFFYCSSLTSIHCKAAVPPSVGRLFDDYQYYYRVILYVPKGTLEAYKSAIVWGEFENIVEE